MWSSGRQWNRECWFCRAKQALFSVVYINLRSSMALKRKHADLFNSGKMVELKYEITNTGFLQRMKEESGGPRARSSMRRARQEFGSAPTLDTAFLSRCDRLFSARPSPWTTSTPDTPQHSRPRRSAARESYDTRNPPCSVDDENSPSCYFRLAWKRK